jgi:hypothetical protein
MTTLYNTDTYVHGAEGSAHYESLRHVLTDQPRRRRSNPVEKKLQERFAESSPHATQLTMRL